MNLIQQQLTEEIEVVFYGVTPRGAVEMTIRKNTKDKLFIMQGYYYNGHFYFDQFKHEMTIAGAAKFFTEVDALDDEIRDILRKNNLD